jgi:hypothetical protein
MIAPRRKTNCGGSHLTIEVKVIGRMNHFAFKRARYAFVRSDGPSDEQSLYDIVDNKGGAERVLAYRVRHKPALEIVSALNALEENRNHTHTHTTGVSTHGVSALQRSPADTSAE